MVFLQKRIIQPLVAKSDATFVRHFPYTESKLCFLLYNQMEEQWTFYLTRTLPI